MCVCVCFTVKKIQRVLLSCVAVSTLSMSLTKGKYTSATMARACTTGGRVAVSAAAANANQRVSEGARRGAIKGQRKEQRWSASQASQQQRHATPRHLSTAPPCNKKKKKKKEEEEEEGEVKKKKIAKAGHLSL